MSLIRLVAIDIDGTLLDPHFQITARNLQALRAAHENGIEVLLATGRRHDYALPVARQLGFPAAMISSNGAVVRSAEGHTFSTDFLPRASALSVVRHMDLFRSHAVLTFDRTGQDALILENADMLSQSIARWIENNAAHIQYVQPLEAAITEDPIQAMFCGNIARMEEAQSRLAEAEFLDEITIMKTQYDRRDLCIIDILNHDCSKGHALRRWAEHQGMAAEEIMAIGDNYNDLEMLQFAGLPVVMENASDDLKQYGWLVTGSNAESGVAQALEQVICAGFQPPIRVK
ncbi:MAG TPA: Cof-type HAD-IIB family hydrolase [Candidatus Angelobacter sp.]|nr:Cof-type HAD-IIB family hydrolase [Candidatus Angelobacter sp.]